MSYRLCIFLHNFDTTSYQNDKITKKTIIVSEINIPYEKKNVKNTYMKFINLGSSQKKSFQVYGRKVNIIHIFDKL